MTRALNHNRQRMHIPKKESAFLSQDRLRFPLPSPLSVHLSLSPTGRMLPSLSRRGASLLFTVFYQCGVQVTYALSFPTH